MKASEVIREAKSVLFERDWSNRRLVEADGSVCVMGAINTALFGTPLLGSDETLLFDETRWGAINALRAAVPDGRIADWNDEPSRTFDDVIDVLDRAEKLAEQRESDV